MLLSLWVMEELRKKGALESDKEIIFSKAIKAGKRIYYLDVKKNRKEEMFLAITESKRVANGNDLSQPSFEKHKIFLYQEDFDKFVNGLQQIIHFIEKNQKITDGVKLNKSQMEEVEILETEMKDTAKQANYGLDMKFWTSHPLLSYEKDYFKIHLK